jgi:hypothetical protein
MQLLLAPCQALVDLAVDTPAFFLLAHEHGAAARGRSVGAARGHGAMARGGPAGRSRSRRRAAREHGATARGGPEPEQAGTRRIGGPESSGRCVGRGEDL